MKKECAICAQTDIDFNEFPGWIDKDLYTVVVINIYGIWL